MVSLSSHTLLALAALACMRAVSSSADEGLAPVSMEAQGGNIFLTAEAGNIVCNSDDVIFKGASKDEEDISVRALLARLKVAEDSLAEMQIR